MKRWVSTGALVVVVAFALLAFAADPCDRFVGAAYRSSHPDGYKPLEDRCEGLLYKPTAAGGGGGLFLVSLLAGNTAAQDNPRIELSFARPAPGPVHIQARPRKSQVLYRMDVETEKSQYAWPATIPRANALSIADLCIMASISISERIVFLPVAVKTNAPEDWPKTAILQSKAPISRVTVNVREAKSDGGWGSSVQLDGGVSLIDSNTAKVSFTEGQLWPADGGGSEATTFEVTLVAPSATGGAPSSTSFVMYARKRNP